MFIGCFSAVKVLHFSEICKFLGENYANIGRFRQEWARIALTEVAHRAPKPTFNVGEKKKGTPTSTATGSQYEEYNAGYYPA